MKIVIIGGSHAGIACAKRAREEYPEFEIIIYEKKTEISFVSQSIPQYLMGQNNLLKHSTYTNARELETLGITVKTQTTIEEVNTSTKRITYTERDNETLLFEDYDKLVLATGSYPIIPPIHGIVNDNIFFIKNKQDALAINDFMNINNSVAVMGGGMVGVELSRIFNQKGMETHLIQASSRLLNKYVDCEVSEQVQMLLKREGLNIHTSSLVLEIKERTSDKNEKELTIHTEREKIVVNGIVISIGFRPNSLLLRNQVLLGDMGAVEVDEYMRTSVDDVFAVGDCATTYIKRRNRKLYLPHASDAFREGAVAAINLMAPKQAITSSQGTYTMNLENYSICVTGMTKEIAQAEGYSAELAYLENHFLNGEEYIKMWLVYDQNTHKILGLEAMGSAPNLSGYVNIISLAIQQNLTIESLEFSDLYFEQGFKNPDSFMKTIAEQIRAKGGTHYDE